MKTITDSIHGSIKVSDLELSIINTKIFNRLHNIYQSSTVYLTFPSNRTKRYEHSIGTMFLAGEMFYRMLCNSDEDTINVFVSYLEPLIKLDESWAQFFRSDCYFNGVIPFSFSMDEGNRTRYFIIYESLRISALLHDIGHPPFSHIIEYALQSFFDKAIEENPNNKMNIHMYNLVDDWVKKLKWNEKIGGNREQLHELIGRKLIFVIRDSLLAEYSGNSSLISLLFTLAGKILEGKKSKRIIKDFVGDNLTDELKESVIMSVLHDIVSSEIDIDRLDFILRDSINSGAGIQMKSYDRLFDNTKLLTKNINEIHIGIVIAYSIKVKDMLDEILRERYYIYNYINYHHRSVKNATLLEEIIKNILWNEYLLNNEEISNRKHLPIDVEGFWVILNTILSVPDADTKLIEEYLLQWDDNWLIVVLKSYRYQKEKQTKENFKNLAMIDELIAGLNNYSTLLKREDETKDFFLRLFDGINEQIQKSNVNDNFKQDISTLCMNVDSFIDYPHIYSKFMTKLLNYSQDLFQLEREVNVEIQRKSSDIEIQIVPVKRLKSIGGTDTTYLYDNKNVLHEYSDYSGIYESLTKTCKYLSPFYILYRDNKTKEEREKSKEDVLKSTINVFENYFAEKLKTLEEDACIEKSTK